MKKRITKNVLLRFSMALAVMTTVLTPLSAWSAEHAEGKEMKMEGKTMEKCEEMKKEKQKMQAEMKAQDTKLTEAVATMNSAAEGGKLNLMAGIVTQMVEQRTAMHTKKAKMQEKMMEHMMQHMQNGKESMAGCPMMKGMKGMDEKSAGDHEGH